MFINITANTMQLTKALQLAQKSVNKMSISQQKTVSFSSLKMNKADVKEKVLIYI